MGRTPKTTRVEKDVKVDENIKVDKTVNIRTEVVKPKSRNGRKARVHCAYPRCGKFAVTGKKHCREHLTSPERYSWVPRVLVLLGLIGLTLLVGGVIAKLLPPGTVVPPVWVCETKLQAHEDGRIIDAGIPQDPLEARDLILEVARQDPHVLRYYLERFGVDPLEADELPSAEALFDCQLRQEYWLQLRGAMTSARWTRQEITGTITNSGMTADGKPYEVPGDAVVAEGLVIAVLEDGSAVEILTRCGNVVVTEEIPPTPTPVPPEPTATPTPPPEPTPTPPPPTPTETPEYTCDCEEPSTPVPTPTPYPPGEPTPTPIFPD